jgi:hypothetical protein
MSTYAYNKRKNRSSSSPSTPISPPVKRNKSSSPIMSVVTRNPKLQLEGSQIGLVRLSPTGIVKGSATVGDVTDVNKFARYIDSIKDIFKNNEKFNSKHIEAFDFQVPQIFLQSSYIYFFLICYVY